MPGFPKQIIGSFEDIGGDIVKNVTQLPADIAGKAIESLTTGKTNTPVQQMSPSEGTGGKKPSDSWDTIDQMNDKNAKQLVARKALEALLGRRKPKEPTVWERIQQEIAQKKEMQEKQKAQQAAASIPMPQGKRARGDLYGMKAKKTAAENRNVRQD